MKIYLKTIGVYLDSTLLDNLTDEERIEMVKERVKELGGNSFVAYDNAGQPISITIAKHTQWFKNNRGRKRYVNQDLTSFLGKTIKQESVVLADELISTSKFNVSIPSKYSHDWLDNNGKNNWERWTTYIQDKEKAVWKANRITVYDRQLFNLEATAALKGVLYRVHFILYLQMK